MNILCLSKKKEQITDIMILVISFLYVVKKPCCRIQLIYRSKEHNRPRNPLYASTSDTSATSATTAYQNVGDGKYGTKKSITQKEVKQNNKSSITNADIITDLRISVHL